MEISLSHQTMMGFEILRELQKKRIYIFFLYSRVWFVSLTSLEMCVSYKSSSDFTHKRDDLAAIFVGPLDSGNYLTLEEKICFSRVFFHLYFIGHFLLFIFICNFCISNLQLTYLIGHLSSAIFTELAPGLCREGWYLWIVDLTFGGSCADYMAKMGPKTPNI